MNRWLDRSSTVAAAIGKRLRPNPSRSEELEHIFEPFYRGLSETRAGTGVGLAISRQTVTVMNGTIEASNEGDSGLSVTTRLPLLERGVDGQQRWQHSAEEALA